uniref:hypothetical protein n=1 Tax=Ferrimicrobium acidiphilum TaxID=121039 RepID=UPI0023EFB6AC
LRENPEWKDAVRAEILGERLQTLPELVSENTRQIASIGDKLDRASNLIAALTERLERVENRLEWVENRLGKMDGRHLESDVLANPRSYIRRKDLSAVRSLSYDERYELSPQLEENEEEELDLLDAILEGETPTGEHVYIAVEVSVTIEVYDLERAKRRAYFLAKATNTPVLPLVVGDEPPSQGRIDEAMSQQVAIARKQRGIVVDAPFIR